MSEQVTKEELNLGEVLDNMRLRFSSRNSIPVERAFIPRDEWGVLLGALGELQERRKQCGDCMCTITELCSCDVPVPGLVDEEICADCGKKL
jgi:hypothetical protein